MNKLLPFCILFFGLQFISNGWSQTQIEPEFLTIDEGLSQGFISAIHQDQEGFLWIGTKNGLNRYDGELFEVFTHRLNDDYSISDDHVTAINELGEYLIFGTNDGRVNLFHKRLRRFYRLPNLFSPDDYLLGQAFIKVLLVDEQQQLWLLNYSKTLLRLQFPENFWKDLPKNEQLLNEIIITDFPSIQLREVQEGSEGMLYGLHDNEQYLAIDIKSGQWQWTKENADADPTYREDAFSFLATLRQYFKWISPSDSGITQTDFTVVSCHYLSDQKQLWLFTDQGILVYNNWSKTKRQLTKADADAIYPQTNYSVTELYKDSSGIIWIGTGGYGLLKVNPRQLKIRTYFKGNTIYAPPFMSPAGEIMIASLKDYMFYHANEQERTFSKQPALMGTWWSEGQNDTLWSVNKCKHGIEIHKIAPEGQFILESKLAIPEGYYFHTAIKEPEADIFWIAHHRGALVQYNAPTKAWKHFEFGHLLADGYDCRALVKTTNKHWWIGTSKGLIHGIPIADTLKFELIRVAEQGLLNDDISSLLADRKNEHLLWIGTKGGGLHLLDTRTSKFTYWTEATGLPNNIIYGVQQDQQGTLWMSSNKGIINLDPASNTIRNFTKADGLQSNEFNTWAYAQTATGELLFGGVSGLNAFHPKDMQSNPVSPKVWITGIRLNNQPIAVGDSTAILQEAVEYT